MAGPDFFQTYMGRTFFEHTMPELVRQLQRLNRNIEGRSAAEMLERAAPLLEQLRARTAGDEEMVSLVRALEEALSVESKN